LIIFIQSTNTRIGNQKVHLFVNSLLLTTYYATPPSQLRRSLINSRPGWQWQPPPRQPEMWLIPILMRWFPEIIGSGTRIGL